LDGNGTVIHDSLPSDRWSGEAGTTGTVAVIGLGKLGLPLVARYAAAGWNVIGVDVLPGVVESVNDGKSHIREEPGIGVLLRNAHAAGRIAATTSHAEAVARADVVIMIVPIVLTEAKTPDYAGMDAASAAVGAGLRPGTLVIYETTLPVGDTRDRYGPLLERTSGLNLGRGADGLYLAFSPERVSSGRVLDDLDSYPKLVGGVDPASTRRSLDFYHSVLDAEVWDLGNCETAEFAKLAETTYRDVNIALANEFAAYAEQVGVDIIDVIRGANSQPYSHVHAPGIGVGGHCIPVYPHFLLTKDPDLTMVAGARRVNDGQVGRAIRSLERHFSSLAGRAVLVLGLTYRNNVNELAYSSALPLIRSLQAHEAEVWAYDPLLSDSEISRTGALPYAWGDDSDVTAIVTQTADPLWSELRPEAFSELQVVLDGRNSLRALRWPDGVAYIGIGRHDPLRGGAAGGYRDPGR